MNWFVRATPWNSFQGNLELILRLEFVALLHFDTISQLGLERNAGLRVLVHPLEDVTRRGEQSVWFGRHECRSVLNVGVGIQLVEDAQLLLLRWNSRIGLDACHEKALDVVR